MIQVKRNKIYQKKKHKTCPPAGAYFHILFHCLTSGSNQECESPWKLPQGIQQPSQFKKSRAPKGWSLGFDRPMNTLCSFIDCPNVPPYVSYMMYTVISICLSETKSKNSRTSTQTIFSEDIFNPMITYSKHHFTQGCLSNTVLQHFPEDRWLLYYPFFSTISTRLQTTSPNMGERGREKEGWVRVRVGVREREMRECTVERWVGDLWMQFSRLLTKGL